MLACLCAHDSPQTVAAPAGYKIDTLPNFLSIRQAAKGHGAQPTARLPLAHCVLMQIVDITADTLASCDDVTAHRVAANASDRPRSSTTNGFDTIATAARYAVDVLAVFRCLMHVP